jgi:hypothetical protein
MHDDSSSISTTMSSQRRTTSHIIKVENFKSFEARRNHAVFILPIPLAESLPAQLPAIPGSVHRGSLYGVFRPNMSISAWAG